MKYNIWIECKAFFTKKKKQEKDKKPIYIHNTHIKYILRAWEWYNKQWRGNMKNNEINLNKWTKPKIVNK